MGCVYVLKDVFKSDIYSNIYVKKQTYQMTY